MKIFSETTFSFIQKAEQFLRDIIRNETPYEMRRSRFLYKGYTCPIHIVIFTGESKIGYFNSHNLQIGLHESIMYTAKDHVIKNIIRHEFAHYLTFLKYKETEKSHGPEFKTICEELDWQEKVSKASLDIDFANNYTGNLESEKVIAKIKALLNLAGSENVHEAELATLKANQLLLKHNIKNLNTRSLVTYVMPVLFYKRKSSKMVTIYEILKHFLVNPIFIYGNNQVSLEISGSKENIELAEYVAVFLERELENMWNAQNHLKGLRAKNSFFTGVAKGYDEKFHTAEQNYTLQDQRALIILKKNLDTQIKRIYQRLSAGTASGASRDNQAFSSGKKAGKSLNINPGIKNKSKNFLLNWNI